MYAADDRLLVGRDAERSARLEPSRYEPNPKRRIDEGVILLGDREYPVPDVFAAVLRRVYDEATRVAGGPTANTMLTYPANWGGQRRKLLVDAAARAGLGHVVLIPEPVAAAVYFTTVLGREVRPGTGIVVYDFGGGTFDTSVVRRRPDGGWEVAASEGLDNVGGLDLDAAVIERIGTRLAATDPARWQRLVHPGDPADRRQQQALWEDVRAAKEQLSRASSAAVHIPLFDTDTHVTREEFEALARPWLERTVALTATALARTGLRPDQVAALFLVGGSSRIPLVSTLLHQRFGIAPTLIEQPELVVGLGSLYAGLNAPAAPVQQAGPVPAPARPAAGPVAAAAPLAVAGAVAAVPPGVPAAPVSPVSAVPVSAAPVSGSPVPGSPVSAAPAAASPVSGAPVSPGTGGPGAPLWPAPPGPPGKPPGPGMGGTGRSFTKRLVLASALAVVVIIALGVGAAKAFTAVGKSSGTGRQPTAGHTRGAGSTATGGGNTSGNNTGGNSTGGNSTGGNAGGGTLKGSIKINKTIWYAGPKITFNTAAYQEEPRQQTVVDVTAENLAGREATGYDAPMTLGAGGKFYDGRNENMTTIPSQAKTPVRYVFDTNGPVDLGSAVITVGEGGKAQASVPLGGSGELVTLEPKNLVQNKKVTAGGIAMTIITCDLRADQVEDHSQVAKDSRSVGCVVDIQNVGDSQVGYLVVDANFRLKLPDGSVVAPEKYPILDLNRQEVKHGEQLRFTIRWPGSGVYTLQLLDLGPSGNVAADAAHTAAVPLQL